MRYLYTRKEILLSKINLSSEFSKYLHDIFKDDNRVEVRKAIEK